MGLRGHLTRWPQAGYLKGYKLGRKKGVGQDSSLEPANSQAKSNKYLYLKTDIYIYSSETSGGADQNVSQSRF